MVVLFAGSVALPVDPPTAQAYAIGDGTGGHLAHQWITREGWRFFESQFGPSEIDAFLGDVLEYAAGSNNRVIEGAYDEDVSGENPWGESGLNHPSLRHFWGHASDFSREYGDGLFLFNSAANRAIAYFTGGRDLLGELDADWGKGQGALPGIGIPQSYQQGDLGRAYYWLGHAAHLLQDVSLPAHAHADPHLEGFGLLDDPDPVHDWVDGREFSRAGTGTDGRPAAAFDDVDPYRYTRWRYLPAQKGVGRAENPQSVLAVDLRSPPQLLDERFNPTLSRPEVAASREPQALSSVEPLYVQFLELASIVDDFDSRDVDGQVDQGVRRDGDGFFNLAGDYDDFTRLELDAVADVIVPHAIRATSELIRYFYSVVDRSPPVVELTNLAADRARPTRLALPEGAAALRLDVEAFAADPTSGVNLDGYQFVIERQVAEAYETVLVSGPSGDSLATTLANGVYRITVEVENGGGLKGISDSGYLEVLSRLTADFDADADVDGDDLLEMLIGFGKGGALLSDGDANGDGDVDRNDLEHWRRELGATVGHPAVIGPVGSVPEPSTLLAAACCMVTFIRAGRRLPVRRMSHRVAIRPR